MNYIKTCDYLSYEAHFTFNDKGDKRYKTLLGGILSLISIIISVSFSIYFSLKLIYKEDSTITYSSERDNSINITYSNKLPFMFRLSDTYSIALNQYNLYNITLLIWYSKIDYKSNKLIQYYDQVFIEKCDIEKHFETYKNYFINIPDLETYFCPRERLYNQSLYGIYGDHKPFLYYVFYFSKCNNLTNDNLCLSDEDSEKILSDAYLDVKYISYLIPEKSNKKNVIVKSDRFLVSATIYKRIWFFFSYIKYYIDTGYFFTSYKKDEYHQFENSKIDIDIRDKNLNDVPGTFLSITILNSGNVNIYKKTFLKIQDYLATIGGIIKAITYICYLLNYFNAINSYYSVLIKDFLIENQIKKKSINTQDLDKSNSNLKLTNFISGNMKKNNIYNNNNNKKNNKKVNSNKNIPIIPKTKSTPLAVQNNNFILKKLKDKENFEQKYHKKLFLPFLFATTSYNDKKEIDWNIKTINRKLNIITVLNLLEQIEKIKKELDVDCWITTGNNNNLNSSLSIIPENECNNHSIFTQGKKTTNILERIQSKNK